MARLGRVRFLGGVIVGIGWPAALPLAADAVQRSGASWANAAFTAVALLSAALWWSHVRERRGRIGLGGEVAGWLLLGSMALFGVAGFLWMLVAMALIASSITYGLVLLVTQSRASSPTRELATGLLLFAGAGASAMFAVTTGLGDTEAWWVPAHLILALGIGAAVVIGSVPEAPAADA